MVTKEVRTERLLEELKTLSINTIVDDYENAQSMMEVYRDDNEITSVDYQDAQDEIDQTAEALKLFHKQLVKFVESAREFREHVGQS